MRSRMGIDVSAANVAKAHSGPTSTLCASPSEAAFAIAVAQLRNESRNDQLYLAKAAAE
jgi:hypothetical protein